MTALSEPLLPETMLAGATIAASHLAPPAAVRSQLSHAEPSTPPLSSSPPSQSPVSSVSSSLSQSEQSPRRLYPPSPPARPRQPQPGHQLGHQLSHHLSPQLSSPPPLPHSPSPPSSVASLRRSSAGCRHSASSSSPFAFRGFHRKHTPITLQFTDVSLTLPNGQQILHSVTGSFPHSRLSAILGASGAGKSSLLNVLAGRSGYAALSGSICINHVPCSSSRLRSYAGFVPQDDILHPDLTVYENLHYSALLRLPAGMKAAQKHRIIDDVLDILGLRSIRDSRVGSVERRGISGGQRKRVNIGTELVANPSLLFMDEPTSGLDASAALEVLSSLRRLADLGLTIVTVVHQPRYSIFSSFSHVLLLAQGGQTVYLGPTEDAMPYFDSLGFQCPEHENPADFLMDVISGVVRERRPQVQTASLQADAADDERRTQAERHCAFPAAPLLSHTSSAPSLAELPMLAATALTRTLSASQSLRNVASLIIDISGDAAADDRKEPVIDFAQAWREHRRQQEEERRHRKERSWSSASGGGRAAGGAAAAGGGSRMTTPAAAKHRSVSTASTVLESPEQRLRSVSDASVDSVGSANSDRSAGSGIIDRGLGAKVLAFLSRAERERQEKERLDALFDSFQQNVIDAEGAAADEQTEALDAAALRARYAVDCSPPRLSAVQHLKSLQGVEEEEEDDASSVCCLSCLSSAASSRQSAAVVSQQSPSLQAAADYQSLSALPRELVFGLPTLHKPPSFCSQFALLTQRLTLKLCRSWRYCVVDLLLVGFLAVTVGWVYGSQWTLGEYTSQSVFSTLIMGVCACVSSLRLFGQDRLVYWRESLVGVSESSYWCSLVLVELHRGFLYPLVFVCAYLPLARPQAAFLTIYPVFVAVAVAMSGLGILLSVVCRPVSALMVATMLPLVVGGFLSGVNPPLHEMSRLMQLVSNLSFTRWAVEPLGLAEAAFPSVYGADNVYWWQDHFRFQQLYWRNIAALVAMGAAFRLITAVALRRFSRTRKA